VCARNVRERGTKPVPKPRYSVTPKCSTRRRWCERTTKTKKRKLSRAELDPVCTLVYSLANPFINAQSSALRELSYTRIVRGTLFWRDVGGLPSPPTIDPARPQAHHGPWTGRASAFHGSRVPHALGPSRNRRRLRSRAQRPIGQPKRGQLRHLCGALINIIGKFDALHESSFNSIRNSFYNE